MIREECPLLSTYKRVTNEHGDGLHGTDPVARFYRYELRINRSGHAIENSESLTEAQELPL